MAVICYSLFGESAFGESTFGQTALGELSVGETTVGELAQSSEAFQALNSKGRWKNCIEFKTNLSELSVILVQAFLVVVLSF